MRRMTRATLVGVLLLFSSPAHADIEAECWGGDLELSMNLDCEGKVCVKDWDKHVALRYEQDVLFPDCTCDTCDCEQEEDEASGEEEE